MSTTAIETDLDTEISTLQSRISTLHSHRANLHAILLSQPHLSTRLSSSSTTTPPSSSYNSSSSSSTNKANKTALDLISQQTRRNQENIYRACAGVTAYKVQDPDPHAVNNGHVLGVRVDVAIGRKFIETYHVLLNWSEEEGKEEVGEKKKVLRIHRHTIPPCIAVQQLAGRWLPTASSSRGKGVEGDDTVESPEQDLVKFGRALRKELVSWHLRMKTVRDLREEAGLSTTTTTKEQHGQKRTSLGSARQVLNAFTSDDEEDEGSNAEEPRDEGNSSRILDIEADAAVRQITVTWANRRTAIMIITKDGRVEKAVSRTKDGVRDVALSRRAIGPLAGLVRRLTA